MLPISNTSLEWKSRQLIMLPRSLVFKCVWEFAYPPVRRNWTQLKETEKNTSEQQFLAIRTKAHAVVGKREECLPCDSVAKGKEFVKVLGEKKRNGTKKHNNSMHVLLHVLTLVLTGRVLDQPNQGKVYLKDAKLKRIKYSKKT